MLNVLRAYNWGDFAAFVISIGDSKDLLAILVPRHIMELSICDQLIARRGIFMLCGWLLYACYIFSFNVFKW